MTDIHLDEHQTRIQKLNQLKQAGVVPYANRFEKTHSTYDLQNIGDDVSNLQSIESLLEQGATKKYSTAGRLMMFRSHGKLSFGTIRDHIGDIQIAFVRDRCVFNTGKEVVEELTIGLNTVSAYKLAEKYFDAGDFIGVHGDLFVTKHGELTLFVNEYQMLSKALRPLGDKRHGIKDEEKIYRQRYLDMTMNEESYQRFLFKSKFYKALRKFYDGQGFEEIVTSVLGNAASGAAAKPFKTHHNDFDLEVFLRIAFEPALKMATVGRYEKVYEIGKDFRNEGSDPSHLQEFTQVEHYAAYWNYEDNMKFAEDMFDFLFEELNLPKVIAIKDKEGNSRDVDWSTPWQRIDYIEGVKQASGGLDITQYSMEDEERLRNDIKALGHEWIGMEQQGVTTMIDYLYKKVLRPSIVGPAFVYNYPKTMQPLARQSDQDPNIVEQFQVVVNGREIIKAYSELVDPTIQEANFEEQGKALEKGDEEATSGDDDFMLAMEHGMPCQSGFGMGLERILALLTGQDNLRDVVMFPLMKPEKKEGIIENREGIHVDKKGNSENGKQKNAAIHSNGVQQEGGNDSRSLLGEVNDLGEGVDFVTGYHDNFRIRKAVRIIAEKDGMIRMIHNAKYDYYALPGGGIDEGESIEDAVHREVREEAGVRLSNVKKIGKVNKHRFSMEIKLFEENYGFSGTVIEEVGTQFKDQEIADGYTTNWYTIQDAIDILNTQKRKYTQSNKTEAKAIVLLTDSEILLLEHFIKSNGLMTQEKIPTMKNSTQGEIEQLVNTYLTDTKLHCQQVGYVMREFARQLGEDEQLWYSAGVLHDIDWDHINKNAQEHLGEQFDAIMDELGADEHLRRAIKSHYPDGTGIHPENLLEKYLISVDELTGFLYAYARMRPEGYTGMKRKSINKKIKDKQFAAGVDRDHLNNCENYLGIPLAEFALSVATLCDQESFPTA